MGPMGIPCYGWDPVHRPQGQRKGADVVNLSYVINVIEDPAERSHVLREAWDLCHMVLVVSAIAVPGRQDANRGTAYSDGILTSRGTFQKHYSHQELRAYIEEILQIDAIPAAPNVFYLFRDEDTRQQFISRKYRRQIAIPRKRVSDVLYEAYRDILDPLMSAVTDLGRLPGPDELPEYADIITRLGSVKRAFRIIQLVTGSEAWGDVARRRAEDLLVFLALARFGRRKPLSGLPLSSQRDVKAFMKTYQSACEQADKLLFSVGKAEAIDTACQESRTGHLVENALLVAREALNELPPILRIYEGCARAILGEVDEANVVKLHRHSGKVTYLAYDNFNTQTNPVLNQRIKVNLRTLSIDFFDYSQWKEPPRLDLDKRLVGLK